MKRFTASIIYADRLLFIMSGVILACMVAMTLFDVVLRNIGHPVTGSVEIIQYGGFLVFSLSVPYATHLKAQVIVDILTEKLNYKNQKMLNGITRFIGVFLFLFIAYHCFMYGLDVRKTGECTPYFRIPLYPFAIAISLTFLLQSITIYCDFIETLKGEKNE